MKGVLACLAFMVLMQVGCGAAHAVTWFDSNIRPDGVSDSNSNVYMAPSEDGAQIVYGGSQDSGAEVVGDVVGDVFDSGD